MRKIFLFSLILVVSISLLSVAIIWYQSLYRGANSSWYGMWGRMMGYSNGMNYNGGQYYGMEIFSILLIPLIAMVTLGVVGIAYYIVLPEIRRSPASPSTTTGQPSAGTVDSPHSPPLSPTSSAVSPAVTPPTALTLVTSSNPPSSLSSASVSPVSDTVSATKNDNETRATAIVPPPSSPSPYNSNLSWPFLIKTSKPDERKILEVLASHEGVYLQKLIAKESGLSKLRTHRIIARLEERGIVKVVESGNTNQVSVAPWLKPPSGQEQISPASSFSC